jgi:uncharacterized cupin superfamily protein
VTDAGEQIMQPGMVAGFPAGKANGHCLINRTTREAVFLVVGSRAEEEIVYYPDIDLELRGRPGGYRCFHKDGSPY